MGLRQSKQKSASIVAAEGIIGSSAAAHTRERFRAALPTSISKEEHARMHESELSSRLLEGPDACADAAARLVALAQAHGRLECESPGFVCEDGAVLAAASFASAHEALSSFTSPSVAALNLCASCLRRIGLSNDSLANSLAAACAPSHAEEPQPNEAQLLQRWASVEPGLAFARFVESLSGATGPRSKLVLQPPELDRSGVSKSRCILNEGIAWLIAQHLPRNEIRRWRLLFSTAANGLSFSALANRASRRGPILIVARDTLEQEACMLMRPKLESWSEPYGDEGVFVATLLPRFQVYKAQGRNGTDSCVHFRHGFTSMDESMGLYSAGGQAALAFGPELYQGRSGVTSLFGNEERLLGDKADKSTSEFEVSELEAYAVDEELADGEGAREEVFRREDPNGRKHRGKAIDRFQQDREFLRISNVLPSS